MYPGTVPTFTAISGTTLVATDDHASRHNSEGSAITALATTLGTTAGTSVLKSFAAGDFPARINTGGTLKHTVVGTVNNSVIGTPTITLGSDAYGDLFYRSSDGTLTRLAIGTNGQILTTNGTTPSWGTIATNIVPKRCKARRSTDQSIANNTGSGITFETSDYDNDSMFPGTAGTVGIQTAGLYLVTGQVQWAANGTESRSMLLYKNGTAQAEDLRPTANSSRNTIQSCSYTLDFSVGDTVSMQVVQWSGGNLNVEEAWVEVIRLGDAS